MSVVEKQELKAYCVDTARRAKAASAELAIVNGAAKNNWLKESARRLRERQAELIAANEQDLKAAPGYGLTDAQVDRLRLTPDRIDGVAAGLEEVAALPDPIGEVIESSIRPNGLEVSKIRVPLGVVFFIYESRPNVTADAAAICIKSGNAVILRGGKEAAHSSRAIVDILNEVATEFGLPSDAVQLVSTTDREAVGHFLSLSELIDVAIPRGGEGLIRRVSQEATMPVIKHFEGNCHVYVDAAADIEMAEAVTINSKCHRLGVCNACESLLVHADVAAEYLPRLAAALIANGIEIRGDEQTCELVSEATPASEEDFAAEFLGPIISVKVVGSASEAIAHINRYGSHHTDAIVTNDLATARRFAASVDSAAVMINASTRFNDGGQFGLGAEIGISTDKFHARGPCGLKELTSYKYVAYGDGHVRE
ncbi:MAG: glutamate-5-semialdehyde dehydrogenase [Planctomycetaceae bacterium]|nr:glutamate-5-semialdehyde dehydrogenase [Planctomycetaceae bacterium]MCB9940790.1 glutamate-5-semialdehyde dehydrogenase [Planctomycetaceae bacterium]